MAIIETLYLSFQITLPLKSNAILTTTLAGGYSCIVVTLQEKGPGVQGMKDTAPYVAPLKEEWMPYFRFAAS